MHKLIRIKTQLLQQLGREATPEELAREMELPIERIAEIEKISQEEIQEPHLEPIETLSIPDESTIISDKVMQNFLKEQEINSICFSDINEDLGVLLGSLTYKKLQKGSYHWAKVKPLYLQKPSITISKKNLI